jgi:hypothetical protein
VPTGRGGISRSRVRLSPGYRDGLGRMASSQVIKAARDWHKNATKFSQHPLPAINLDGGSVASVVVKFRQEAVYKISSASGRWLLALADQIEKTGGKFVLQVPSGTLATGTAGKYGWDLASRPDDVDKARKVLIRKAITCGAVVGETPAEIEKDPDLIVAISDLILDVLMQFTSVMREATGDMGVFYATLAACRGNIQGRRCQSIRGPHRLEAY